MNLFKRSSAISMSGKLRLLWCNSRPMMIAAQRTIMEDLIRKKHGLYRKERCSFCRLWWVINFYVLLWSPRFS